MSIEFCSSCNVSISKADMTIKDGDKFVSHDFLCPNCGKPANPDKQNSDGKKLLEASEENDLIIKEGNAELI